MASVSCSCGEVRGVVANANPRTVNRVICYCDDCQAFAHYLKRADVLDAHGGSDIVQVGPASLTFERGHERIAGLRLSPKGLYRWHARCCGLPLGNTVGPQIPFVGIVAQAFEHGAQRADEVVGKPTGAILGQYAVGSVPQAARGMPFGIVVRAVLKVAGWRLRGQAWPNPFFERPTRAPIYPVSVLAKSDREALRAYCGPHPTARPV